MPRTALTVVMLTGEGASLVTEAADVENGNSCVPSGPTLISFYAPGGGTVTIRNPRYDQGDAADGLKVPDRILTLPPATVWLWVCPQAYYEQADGLVWLDFGQPTSVAAYAVGG